MNSLGIFFLILVLSDSIIQGSGYPYTPLTLNGKKAVKSSARQVKLIPGQ